MKIIHIVRDIRDVMVSLRRTGWVGDLDLYYPRFWSNSNLYLNALYEGQESRYLLVRYENLVSDPVTVFRGICGFLGVAYQAAMLDHGRRHPRYEDKPHHARLYEPISAASVGSYKQDTDVDALRSCERQAHEALERFGYLQS